jgi:hypothetical protein
VAVTPRHHRVVATPSSHFFVSGKARKPTGDEGVAATCRTISEFEFSSEIIRENSRNSCQKPEPKKFLQKKCYNLAAFC